MYRLKEFLAHHIFTLLFCLVCTELTQKLFGEVLHWKMINQNFHRKTSLVVSLLWVITRFILEWWQLTGATRKIVNYIFLKICIGHSVSFHNASTICICSFTYLVITAQQLNNLIPTSNLVLLETHNVPYRQRLYSVTLW